MRFSQRLRAGFSPVVFAVGLCALAGLAGCASAGYQPLAQTAASPVAERWHALQDLARAEGWQILNANESTGTMDAVQPDSADLRDHITITIHPDRTVVAIHTEIRSGQEWLSTSARCRGYKYSREQTMATRLEGKNVEPDPSWVALDP
jgi:hypothetical protein